MRHKGKAYGALDNTSGAGSGGWLVVCGKPGVYDAFKGSVGDPEQYAFASPTLIRSPPDEGPPVPDRSGQAGGESLRLFLSRFTARN